VKQCKGRLWKRYVSLWTPLMMSYAFMVLSADTDTNDSRSATYCREMEGGMSKEGGC
jgi:hypothetical protein